MMIPPPYAMQPSWTPMPLGYPAMPMMTPIAEIGPVMTQGLVNGAKGYFQQVPNQSQSQVSVLLPIGAGYGAGAMMLGELLTGGSEATKRLLNDWSREGIKVHAYPIGEKLNISVIGPAGAEQRLVESALQLLTRPVVEESRYRSLKEDALKRFEDTLVNPDYPIMATVQKAFYPNHPYGKSVEDVARELQAQSMQDVIRLNHNALQFPEYATVSMVSAQPVEAQQQILNQGIQQFNWYASPYRQRPLVQTPPVQLPRGVKGPVFQAQESLQYARIIHTWQAPAINDPDYPAFLLLKELLGGMSGGFFRELRTRQGLVYGTQQSYDPHKGVSDYSVSAQVDFDKIGQTLTAVQKVAFDYSQQSVSGAELEMIKKKALLKLRGDKQKTETIAASGNSWLVNDLSPMHPDTMQRALERVTTQDIQRVANRVFNPQTGYQVIGVSAPQRVLDQFMKQKYTIQSS